MNLFPFVSIPCVCAKYFAHWSRKVRLKEFIPQLPIPLRHCEGDGELRIREMREKDQCDKLMKQTLDKARERPMKKLCISIYVRNIRYRRTYVISYCMRISHLSFTIAIYYRYSTSNGQKRLLNLLTSGFSSYSRKDTLRR